MIFWGVAGSIAIRRRYLHRDLDTSNATFVGAMMGAATGPLGLVPLWIATPELTRRFTIAPALGTVFLVAVAFSFGASGALLAAIIYDGTVQNSVIIMGSVGALVVLVFLLKPLIAPGPPVHHPDELARD